MKRILVQLDNQSQPSSFDSIVALDAGVDQVLAYGHVTVEQVPALVQGALFTRGPQARRHTAVFVGGRRWSDAQQLGEAVRAQFFGHTRLAVMLDPSGSATTAAAVVAKVRQVTALAGLRAIVLGGTGAVGSVLAGLLCAKGCEVTISGDSPERTRAVHEELAARGQRVDFCITACDADVKNQLQVHDLVVATGPPGRQLCADPLWQESSKARYLVDINSTPPAGISGIGPYDDWREEAGHRLLGPLAVGRLKLRLQRAAIARLYDAAAPLWLATDELCAMAEELCLVQSEMD